jgi:type IV secretion system protein VirB4
LGLGSIALAFTAASDKSDQIAITDLLATHGRDSFAPAWLRHKGLDWAAKLLEPAAAPDAVAA